MKAGALVAAMLAMLLAACSADVRATKLADVNLADMEVVQDIRGELPPEDRALFSTYVVKHVATSRLFCGEVLVDRRGREPRTIGEAIALTAMREDDLRRERLAAERPPTAIELVERERDGLVAARESLIARRTQLFSVHGPAAMKLPEWESLNTKMADYDARLETLQKKLEATTS